MRKLAANWLRFTERICGRVDGFGGWLAQREVLGPPARRCACWAAAPGCLGADRGAVPRPRAGGLWWLRWSGRPANFMGVPSWSIIPNTLMFWKGPCHLIETKAWKQDWRPPGWAFGFPNGLLRVFGALGGGQPGGQSCGENCPRSPECGTARV